MCKGERQNKSINSPASLRGHQLLNGVWKHLSSWKWESQRGLGTDPSLAANTTALFIMPWVCWAWTSKSCVPAVEPSSLGNYPPQATTAPTRWAAKPFRVVAPHHPFPCSQQNGPYLPQQHTSTMHHSHFPQNWMRLNSSAHATCSQSAPTTHAKGTHVLHPDTESLFFFLIACGYQ